MTPKLLRFCAAFALVLLAAALPLWLLWRRAESARRHAMELSGRSADSARKNADKKQTAAAQRMALLESAPARLSGESFLEWETFCAELPWAALRPVLDKRLAENSGTDEVRTLLLIRWAGEDGAASAAWAKEHLPEKNRAFANTDPDLSSLGATWAWHDPAGFTSAQKGEEKWADQGTMGRWLAPRDAALAFEMVRRPYDPATDWTRDAAETIAPFLKTVAEAKGLMERVNKERHDESDPAVNYMTALLQAWADMDETGALAAAASYPGDDGNSLKAEITNYVMRGRPQTEANADEWMQRLPENRMHSEMEEIVAGLMSADMGAAGRWLLKQDPKIRYDSVRDYLHALTLRDPAAALEYATALPVAGRNDPHLFQVVAPLAEESPAAATALLKDHGWSEPRIAQLKDRMAADYPETAQWWWDW